MRLRSLVIAISCSAIAAATLAWLNNRPDPALAAIQEQLLHQGTVSELKHPLPLPEFSLTTHHGEAFNLADLKGHWTLLFFGYSHCPDVCGLALRHLSESLSTSRHADVSALFVSLDPERDTVSRMAQFLDYFHPKIIGLTGDKEGLAALASQAGIVHRRVYRYADDAHYDIDHAASVLVVNPSAAIAAVFIPPLDSKAIAGWLDQRPPAVDVASMAVATPKPD